jgi:3-hydroxyisobutyrate dehydrogenase-like beta-hydroxyacid dehydrogenase
MSVAVVGLGAMGGRIARRLLAAGEEVTVWNRTAERAAPLAEAGASVAATPAAAARSANWVITMLADPSALLEVMSRPDGLAQGLRAGQTLVEMSTVGPSTVRQLVDIVPPGVEVVDAPVLGSISEVDAGTLRIFVGGSDEAAASVRPLLEPLGQPLHVGPLGAGASAKLVANTTLLGTMAVLGEALALAKSLGLDPDAAFEVLSTTPLSAQAERRRPVIEGAEPPVRFRLALATKDADVIVDEGRRAGVDAEITKVAAARFRAAEEAGDGDRDYAAILRRSVSPAGAPRSGWAS